MIFSATNKFWQAWLQRRCPASAECTLSYRHIFIFPSRYGWIYLASLTAIFIGGVNYGNELMLALTFLLVSIFLVSILHTYRNLSEITLKAGQVEHCFLGEQALFRINVQKPITRSIEEIHLCFKNSPPSKISLIQDQQGVVELFIQAVKRGRLKPGRIKVETIYPLGIIRAWSWIDLMQESWVFPKPIAGPLPSTVEVQNIYAKSIAGVDEYEGLRNYVPGDSMSHVYWKVLSRGLPLTTKIFSSSEQDIIWLGWDKVAVTNNELKLSHLCYWVLQLAAKDILFGLALPGTTIQPDRGLVQRNRCLKALAAYP